MKFVLGSAALLLFSSLQIHAATLGDVKTADCKRGESFLQINLVPGLLSGKLGTLQPMKNVPVGETQPTSPIEFNRNQGSDYSTLGALVTDETGYWGGMSLYTKVDEELGTNAVVHAVFGDQEGTMVKEDLDCKLTF